MSYLTCTSSSLCGNPANHSVQLAESNDGATWTSVPGFTAYTGSVPDVVTRNNKLYIYTPGFVKRYDRTTNTWDAITSSVSVKDASGTTVNYVDPSLIVDSSGNLVMFFLQSGGAGTGDPATCTTFPCTKSFLSATEVSGSDGTQFVTNSGTRISITLTTSGSSASDPDIFFDGTNYVCYISKGNSIQVYTSTLLHGTYSQVTTLSSGTLTNEGGIPSGYFDPLTSKYWTYIHTSVGEIKFKTHADFSTLQTGFTTIITGATAGLGSGSQAQSPGFCKSTLTASSTCTGVSATATAATNTTFCTGGSVVLNANTGTGFTYQWLKDAVNISGATSASYTASANGTYTVTVTNASACVATSSGVTVTVNTVPSTPTVTAATSTSFCTGGTVVLNASSGSGLTYQWLKDAVNISGATSASYTANASGSFAVKVTNTSTCVATSGGVTVTVNTLPSTPTVTAVSTTTFCTGGSVVLNASTGSGLTYQWLKDVVNISGASSASYSAIASGSYTVTVVNTNACSASSTAIIVTVNSAPAKPIITKEDSGRLVSSSLLGNQWYKDGVAMTDTTQKIKPTVSGSYTVKVTQNGCSSNLSDAYTFAITAIVNFSNGQYLKTYPNPVKENFIIEYKLTGQSQIRLMIYDLNGKLVLNKEKVSNGSPIRLDGLKAGTYALRIFSKEGKVIFTDIIIKQ